MKIINAGYGLIEEESVTKKIERIARVCYKSEGLITEGSDIKMLSKLMERKHYAMFEHASLVYVVPKSVYDYIREIKNDAMTAFLKAEEMKDVGDAKGISRIRDTFSVVNGCSMRYIVSGNVRAWVEFFEFCAKEDAFTIFLNPIVKDLYNVTKGIVDFTMYIKDVSNVTLNGEYVYAERITDFTQLNSFERMVHETFSVIFTVDRGVTHELVRMRDCSFAQESTRYCNYSADKYGDEITVIKPIFFEEGTKVYENWQVACAFSEAQYIYLTKELNVPAQQARDVLPTSVKADIVMTTNLQEWRHIFELRACDATGPAHPQMKEVMCPLCKEMQEKYKFAFGDLVVAE